MQLKRLLLTTTSLCMLTFAPLPVLAQDAALVAAYGAYVEASSGDDADAKAAAEAEFLAVCGLPSLEEQPGEACTLIYGGPERFVVEGLVEGEPVSIEVTRANGCAIERYDRLEEALRG